ncbi:MAG TPA: transcription-repair coupling factor, partial [Sporichthya sp.]|nr:transcription-repair coupling factor [Sporichthya sp.]
MPLSGLLDVVATDPVLADALVRAEAGDLPALDLISPPGSRPFAIAALAARTGRMVLAVVATGREAEDLQAALGSLLPPERVAVFPSWETLPHERMSPRADTVGRRLAVLRRITRPIEGGGDIQVAAGPLDVVICPVRSLVQPMVPGLGELEPVSLRVGDEIELDAVVDGLAGAAYARVDLVERRGEFAVRGGLVDVFPPTEEHPLRVEFWGDTVEEIRPFKIADQRSIDGPGMSTGPVTRESLWAPPCRELLLTKEVRARAAALLTSHPELADIVGRIAEGIAVEGMEALSPVLVDRMELLVDQVPRNTLIVACDPERIRARAHDLVRTSQEFLEASWSGAAVGGQAPIDLGAAALRDLAEVRDHARALGLPWWTVAPFASTDSATSEAVASEAVSAVAHADSDAALGARPPEAYRGETERAVADIKGWLADGWSVVLVAAGHGTAQRMVEVLAADSLPARMVDEVPAAEPGMALVTCGELATGFLDE